MNADRQAALDQVSALVVVLDLQGRILWWNRAYRELTGHDDSRLPVQHFNELVAPEDRASAERAFRELPRDGAASYEYPLQTVSGDTRWVAWTSRFIDDNGGQAVLSTGVDRTRERGIFLQLQASEERLRELMSASADAIIWFGEDRRIQFFNRAAEEMWAISANEVLGCPLDKLVPKDRRPIVDRVLRMFAESEQRSIHIGANHEVRGLRGDGSEFYGDLILVKARSSDGWLFLIAMRDITPRKRMEHEQRFFGDVGRVISSTHERDEILHAVAQLAVATVADCCVVDVIGAAGIERLSAAHKHAEMAWIADGLRAIHIRQGAWHPLCEAIDSRQPLIMTTVEDAQLVAMAQDERHLALLRALGPRSLLVIPFFLREQLLGAMLLFSRTAARYSDESLPFAEETGRRIGLALENARLYRALEQAIQSRDDVLGIVAHDLKSPLSAIQMAAHGLETFTPDDARARRLIDVIRSSGQRMTSLVADLLDIASMEAGHLRLKRRPLDARDVVTEALVGVAAVAEAADIRITVVQPDDAVALRADRLRCGQILSNLLGNAVKFTPRGGHVDVILERHRQHAIFVVRDSGPGLSPEAKKHLFEPFWQRRRSTGEGVGLGLAIARGLVLAHGGEIGVESEVGQGCTFWFRLPLGAARSAEEVQEIAPLSPRSPG